MLQFPRPPSASPRHDCAHGHGVWLVLRGLPVERRSGCSDEGFGLRAKTETLNPKGLGFRV